MELHLETSTDLMMAHWLVLWLLQTEKREIDILDKPHTRNSIKGK